MLQKLILGVSADRPDKAIHDELRNRVQCIWIILAAELEDFTHGLGAPVREVGSHVWCLVEIGHEVVIGL